MQLHESAKYLLRNRICIGFGTSLCINCLEYDFVHLQLHSIILISSIYAVLPGATLC